MKKKACAFTGLRPEKLPMLTNKESVAYLRLRERIRAEIIRLIEIEHVRLFRSGMARGVDMLAARLVLELETEYSNIALECVIPYENQASSWTERERDEYFDILAHCDPSVMLQTHYSGGCLHRRNRYLVDSADVVLAVWNGADGGTAYTVEYAKKQEKELIVINPDEE